jgi:acyl-CoA reductase-like NAD-dependent aldehyde dehydrogenase
MKIFLAGNWIDKAKKIEVRNPFDNAVFETVPRADGEDLEKRLYTPSGAPRSWRNSRVTSAGKSYAKRRT